MATRTAELKVVLDGEKEYKQAISEINKRNRVLASELRKVTEEYKGNEASMEALTAKQDVLNRQLQQQKDKVATLQGALERAAKEYGEADRRTQEWQIQLNNAETAQIRLERELEQTNKAIETQTDDTEKDSQQMSTLGDQVSSLAEKFGVHLPSGIKNALDNVDGFSTGTVAAMGAAVAGIGAVELAIKAVSVGLEAVQKLNEITLEQAKWADDLLTQSAQTGLDLTTLQGLDYASNFLDFEGIDQSLVKLTVSMDKARDGADKQAEAFAKLGVSVVGADGQLRDNWETFKDVIDALGEVENATERDALSNDIFGKSYSELKPLIDAGSDSLQGFMDKAQENGYVLDESQVKKLGEVDDAYREYQTQIETTKKKLAVEFAPIATKVMQDFGQFVMDAGGKLIESGIIENLGKFVEPLGTILGVLGDLIDWALPVITPMIDGLATAFQWAADTCAAFVNWLTQLDEEAIAQTMADVGDMGYNGAAAYNAAGTDNWRGGLTWVGETGPELVSLPRGSQILNNQESEQLVTGVTAVDLSRVEQLLLMIYDEFSGMEMRRRML